MPSIDHNPLQRSLNDIPQHPTTSCRRLCVSASPSDDDDDDDDDDDGGAPPR